MFLIEYYEKLIIVWLLFIKSRSSLKKPVKIYNNKKVYNYNRYIFKMELTSLALMRGTSVPTMIKLC